MKILNDLISSIPGSSVVREVHACALWTAVVSNNCGLASTFRTEHSRHGNVREAGNLTGKSALELAEYAKSDNLLEASIGMATINSSVDIDEDRCTKENALAILAKNGSGKKIAIVGHFPWIPQLREIASEVWVIEQRPREGDLPADAAEDILPRADIVAITGTSLINHTIEKLLDLSKNSFTVLIGPTSPLSPVLFDYGVDVIAGTKVIEPEKTIRCIGEGAMFKQLQGIELICMAREKA